MATEFKLPELGENIASGDIVSVLVKEGDTVRANQGVFEIETDKAVVEVPCSVAGRVTKVHVKPGQTVKVGETVLTIEAGAAAAPAAKPAATAPKAAPAKPPAAAAPPKPTAAPQPAKPQAAPAAKPAPTPAAKVPAIIALAKAAIDVEEAEEAQGHDSGNGHATPHDHVAHPAGPAVRRLARELGVDLGRVAGTGDGGRITTEDVKAAVRQATSVTPANTGNVAGRAPSANNDSWGAVRREPMPKIRKTIALNMAKSAATIPHVTNFDDADVTELEKMRKITAAQYADSGIKLTMLAFVIKAIAHSLKAHPTINASLDMDGGEIIYKEYVNIGLAVDAPRGLIVPVMRNVDKLSIPQIAQQITTLADKAKSGQFGIDDLRGGSFTISNMGSVGGTYSTPIINPPEVAILLVGRSRKLPVVLEDQDDKVAVRLMLPLSLSYDHRLVDGVTAARFLNEIIGYLEVPGRLLLAP